MKRQKEERLFYYNSAFQINVSTSFKVQIPNDNTFSFPYAIGLTLMIYFFKFWSIFHDAYFDFLNNNKKQKI